MKNQFALFTHYVQKVDRQHIQLVIAVISLALFVLGVGAPADTTGPGPR